MTRQKRNIAILGAGLAGCCAALELARKGYKTMVFDRSILPINQASLHNEGKLHLGYVYARATEDETHKKMIEGSLQFLGIIEYLTGIPHAHFNRSSRFKYAVPKATMLPLENILSHFQKVDTEIERFIYHQQSYKTHQRINPSRLLKLNRVKHFNRNNLLGVIETPEYSVDPVQIANIVSASVLSSDMIDFRGHCEITKVSKKASGGYQIYIDDPSGSHTMEFDACINCLWEERIKLDKLIGIQPKKTSLTRYKASITFFHRGDVLKAIPSTTLVSGAFGDVVNYQNGLYYLSWYPACKIGQTIDEDVRELKSKISRINKEDLIFETISKLSKYLKPVNKFINIIKLGKVGGGFICGWAKTDITDPNSQLHGRNDIGVVAHGRWISVNTGKYCTAPLYGTRAAEQLIKSL